MRIFIVQYNVTNSIYTLCTSYFIFELYFATLALFVYASPLFCCKTVNRQQVLVFHGLAGATTLSPVLGEGVLGQDGAAGHAGGQLELRGVRRRRDNHQEREEPPAQPLRQLSVAPPEAGI